MTLQEMASAVRNNVSGGLREVYNHAYSIPQIEDEIRNTRNIIILEDSMSNQALNLDYFTQKIENIPLKLVHFPFSGYSNSPERVPHTKIPGLVTTSDNSALSYFGPPDFSVDFYKYFDTGFQAHQYSRVISKRPYVFLDLATDDNDNHDAYLFNVEKYALREVSIRGVFANPFKLMENAGLFVEDQEFPAPLAVQEMIIDRITAKYVEYYRKMNQGYQPNTQTDIR